MPLKAIVDGKTIIGPDFSREEWADLKSRHRKGLTITMDAAGHRGICGSRRRERSTSITRSTPGAIMLRSPGNIWRSSTGYTGPVWWNTGKLRLSFPHRTGAGSRMCMPSIRAGRLSSRSRSVRFPWRSSKNGPGNTGPRALNPTGSWTIFWKEPRTLHPDMIPFFTRKTGIWGKPSPLSTLHFLRPVLKTISSSQKASGVSGWMQRIRRSLRPTTRRSALRSRSGRS